MAHYKFHNDCQSSVLTYEQVKRLDHVMDQVVPVHGRGNAPTLFVKLKELIRLVKYKLQHEHSIEIRDVRLNGGASNYVLAPENSHYNDLDLVFGTDLSNEDRFDVIRDVVLECLMEFYPKEGNQQATTLSASTHEQEQNLHPGTQGNRSVNCGNMSELSSTHFMQSTGDGELNVKSVDDDAQSEQSSGRSNRSSSFESDNLNITKNDVDDESDDEHEVVEDDDDDDKEEEDDDDDDDEEEEDNIIVRIDSDYDSLWRKTKNSHDDIRNSRMVESSSPNQSNVRTLDHSQANHSDAREESSAEAAEMSAVANQRPAAQVNCPSQHALHQYIQMPPNNCAIKEAYVHKMVKVNDDDRWSLISLGVQQSERTNYNQMQRHQASAGGALSMCCAAGASCSQAAYQAGSDCQQRQLPNSIELKFVDRMRRKFEFSVDSFQIILDSLIQFYDYAPQSTITIQRKLSSFHPSSTMVNTHPMIDRRSSCERCGCFGMQQQRTKLECASSDQHDENSVHGEGCKASSKTQVIDQLLDFGGSNNTGSGTMKKKRHSRQLKSSCETSLNGSRSYHDLPMEPGNSLSNSSVASSSGCSSSSSVVSSSSSSLSCDEDHEDLYGDVDNSPSSSASTSSLLSSTTISVLSSAADETRSRQVCDDEAINDKNIDQISARKLTTGKQTKKLALKRHCFGGECNFESSKLSSCAVISENFYPTVIGRSEYGNFIEALYHLEKKLIATRSPEEIRGGGLLKYCNLLVKNYKPTNVLQIRTLERYMCSRFFIDFSDLNQQRAKLESYLANHFCDDPMQKFHYLTILHNVVQRSTVCLMNHELRLTLNMIRELAYELNDQQQQHQVQQVSQQRVAMHQQLFNQLPRQQGDQHHQYQPQQHQQKPIVMQSGVYRVKLVNYSLPKSIKS